MSISKKVLNYLEKNKIRFEIIKHKTVYTAYDLASTLKAKLNEVAKTLVIKADHRHILVVLPANNKLDLKKLKKFLKAKKIEIAKEGIMPKVFKVKAGLITPFGKLYQNTPVYIDKALLKAKKIVTSAGSFEESLHLKVKDFLKATEGKLGSFGKKR